MALPTLVKTWQHNVNNQITAQGTALADNRKLLRSIKNAMIGFGTNPWTVRYSCDSSSAGSAGDGVDKWAADSNLVWAAAGSAHSWIVLRQTGIATNFELLLSCEGAAAGGNVLTIVVSPSAAFTGGSTTARPTATDEIVLINGASWSGISSDISSRWSVQQSTDGQSTRVIICASGAPTAYWLLEKPANPTTGWSNPSVFAAVASSPTIAALTSTATPPWRMRSGSTTGNVTANVEGNNNALLPSDATVGNIANEIDSGWPMFPIGFACYTTGIRGRHGSINDLWMGSSSVASGDTYPGDASNQFAQFGILIFPWNGSTPALS